MSRLTLEYKQALWALPLPVNGSFAPLVNESLGLAAFYWDITAIHGLSTVNQIYPAPPGVTVLPHSIAQAATWDVDLTARALGAIALEARIVNQVNFRLSNGRGVQCLNAEGGPLANTVHDP